MHSENAYIQYVIHIIRHFYIIKHYFKFLVYFYLMDFYCCSRPSKYKPVTHIIFDLDGTIIDSEKFHALALKSTIEDYGCEYFPEFYNKVKGSVAKEVARKTIEWFNIDTTIDDLIEKFDALDEKYLSDVELMPGAERIILHFYNNNIPIAIATSSCQKDYEVKTNKFPDLFSKFHHIVCGGSDPEVKNGKPAPDIFFVAASRFDDPPDPSKCLVFEDSINGLKAGLAAGMQVVMFPEASISYDHWKLATLRLDSFNYMMPELFGLPPFPEDDVAPEFAGLIAPKQESEPENPLAKPVVEQEDVPVFGDQISAQESGLQGEETPVTENEETSALTENEEIEIVEAPEIENEEAPVTENEEAPVTDNEEPPATEET